MRCKSSWRSTLQLSHLAVEILTPVYLENLQFVQE